MGEPGGEPAGAVAPGNCTPRTGRQPEDAINGPDTAAELGGISFWDDLCLHRSGFRLAGQSRPSVEGKCVGVERSHIRDSHCI
jgi:hypothetical protein